MKSFYVSDRKVLVAKHSCVLSAGLCHYALSYWLQALNLSCSFHLLGLVPTVGIWMHGVIYLLVSFFFLQQNLTSTYCNKQKIENLYVHKIMSLINHWHATRCTFVISSPCSY